MFDIKNSKFLIWDQETEGLSLLYSRPWELSWLVYHGYQETENHQYFLKWPGGLKVSAGAAKVTNYNPLKIEKEGKNPKEIIDLFWDKYLMNNEYKVLGANLLGYDCMILNSARRMLGYETDYSYLNRCYDTVALAKSLKLNLPFRKSDNFLAWQYKMLNIKAKGVKTSNSTMYKELTGKEIDRNLIHSGIYDCAITTSVFFELVKRMEF